uniref:Capsid protein n=1 Tax=Dependoparvovirus sp. TaxID=2052559 RepID=A0A6M9Z6N5_9VIRU|nr:MAG: capsid protein [Dependoparvovirus sp.]QKN88773.1 MAG: capsid protein [Dependoparvovirus sp.]
MAAEGVVPDWLERFIKKNIYRPIGKVFQGAKDRGAVLPGYKYLGPFNSLDKGEPVNEADAAALEHDKAYDKELEEGKNPYLTFNKADEKFMSDLKDDRSFGGNLAKALFQAKKRILEPYGRVDLAGGDKITDYYPAKKKAKTGEDQPREEGGGEQKEDPGEGTSQQNGPDGADSGGGGGEQAVPGTSTTMAAGAGAPMADDNQASDGVGESSGNWHCDSTWMGDHVHTSTTRTWVLPAYNNYIYKAVTSNTNDKNHAFAGYSTPWGYFDFNRFHCHFSPRDWQRLVNNHTGFRPKALKVKIFNIQVKEVTIQDETKTIANNLTSTVQIFADNEYMLPYVGDSATEGTLPPFPADIYQVPQYGYLTYHKWTDTKPNGKIEFTDRSAFYCLEYFPSSMLRTGNNFEFTFQFEDVPFHASYAHSQYLDRIHNPLVDQYLWGFDQVTNKEAQWKIIKGDTNANRYRNWLPGPMIRDQRVNVYVGGTDNYNNFTAWKAGSKFGLENRENLLRPGIPCPGTDLQDTSHISGNNNLTFPKDPYIAKNTQAKINQVMITDETEMITTNPVATKPWGACAINSQEQTSSTTIEPKIEALDHMGVQPGMCWQNRDLYLQGPIWAKIPDTEAHFHPVPHMGGFGLKRPPPQIFIKQTPVPADPQSTLPNQKWNSFITQYATGQITVEILWELQKENSKRWNPEIQFTSNFGKQDFKNIPFAPNNEGTYQEPRLIGTRWLSKHL